MDKFRAFRVHRENNKVFGRVENLNISDLSKGEVVIKASYSSVNYKDALASTGAGKIIRNFPRVSGINVSGYVVSSSDKRFKDGDPVIVTGYEFGVNHDGGYAEYVRVPSDWVVALPKGMSLFNAMAIGTAGFTVALCVQRLEENNQLPELGKFIITGASGGVGNFAIDIMSALGYQVVAVTGKPDRHQSLIDLGADHLLDRNTIDLKGAPLEKGQWGGAIDNLGGEILSWLTKTVNVGGNIASVGLAGGTELNTTVMPFILRGVSILGINAPACSMKLRTRLWERLVNDLAPKKIDMIVTNVVQLEDLPDVFKNMLAGKTFGRTVVSINPEK